MPAHPEPTDPTLDAAQRQADPLADDTIARCLGDDLPLLPGAGLRSSNPAQWERIAQLNRAIVQWQDNATLAAWQAPPDWPPEMAAAVRAYLDAASVLPDWADRAAIARAEAIFFDQGLLSVLLLFCASLPECYVVPDLAEVLHVTGQLEQRTDYRIRSTAAMIFPVMMKGGLTDPSGGGIAQVLKVRLIHALVRHLILHGSPAQGLAGGGRVVPRLEAMQGTQNMHEALFAHGWDVAARGLPSNQEEQAYTLLTFGYVTLRGLRTLGQTLPPADEAAVLHTWNVVGHLVGIRRELMVDTLDEADSLFERMQRRGRAEPRDPDPRGPLAAALFDTMARVIRWRVLAKLPVLLSRRLIGPEAARDLRIDDHVGWLSRALFMLLEGLVRTIDAIGRLFSPHFSLARMLSRLLGYRLMTQLLMDQTRPLRLPERLLGQTHTMMRTWSSDARAPGWQNALERCLAGRDAEASS